MFDKFERTKTEPSVGRQVHLYSREFDGPRPATIVTMRPGQKHALVDLFVMGNGGAGDGWEQRTAAGVPLLDPLDDTARGELRNGVPRWCEWPPTLDKGGKKKADGQPPAGGAEK